MKKVMFMLSALFLMLCVQTQAQKLALEKTYEITRKAKRGYLDSVGFDNKTQITTLAFVTKNNTSFTGSATKVKYEYYRFDKEYNFIKVDEEETTYKNSKYKGENYSIDGISVENNLFGTFILKKRKQPTTGTGFRRL